MARRTAGYVRNRAQVVLLYQVRAERKLIGVLLALHLDGLAARRLLVTHVENLVARPEIFFRRPMALQAPLHLQRSLVIHQGHAVHRTVAGVAAYTLIDMNAVIEIGEVGQIIHPGPDQ